MDAQGLRDERIHESGHSPGVKKGRFMWREEPDRRQYIRQLTARIRQGYYQSDDVLDKVVEELAPAFSDSLEQGSSGF